MATEPVFVYCGDRQVLYDDLEVIAGWVTTPDPPPEPFGPEPEGCIPAFFRGIRIEGP